FLRAPLLLAIPSRFMAAVAEPVRRHRDRRVFVRVDRGGLTAMLAFRHQETPSRTLKQFAGQWRYQLPVRCPLDWESHEPKAESWIQCAALFRRGRGAIRH